MPDQYSPGDLLAGYRIDAVLGRGGMGVVYRAHQERLARNVAIKVIAPDLARDEGFRERFIRESRAAAAIEHANVVPIYEANELEDGTLFLVMRLIGGTDLGKILRDQGRLEPGRAASLLEGVAAALDEAHSTGLVHRDVKPANVLVAPTRGGEQAFLTDFGLTKRASSEAGLTATGQWLGTIDYAAPEQIEGRRVDARADVYSLGCVAFQMLAGKIPYERDSDMAKLWAHVHEPPPDPGELDPRLPGELRRVVQRAMAKEPDERFPSAGDLARSFTAAVHGQNAAEPERTVAAGAAAPTTPTPTAGTPETMAAAPARPTRAAEPRTRRITTPGGAEVGSDRAAGRRRLALLGGLMALAVAGVAALALAGTFDGDGSGEPGSSPESSEAKRGSAGSGRDSSPDGTDPGRDAAGNGDFTELDTGEYTVQAPASWNRISTEAAAGDPAGSFYHTELTSPDGLLELTIDRTPDAQVAASENAQVVEDAVSSETPGYRRLAFGEIFLGSSPDAADPQRAGFEWQFRVIEQGEELQKVDYFFNADGDGFAVLGTARPGGDPDEVFPIALHAAQTLDPLR